MRYTFGNSEAAARRLETVAEFFNPPARKFIQAYVKGPVAVAVDLGCGPGFTTAMLRETLAGTEVYGLDNSPAFLELAQRRFPECHFLNHDVTVQPLPVRGDVIYERFLLPHLVDPVELVSRWVRELAPGGLLLIDEMEAIQTAVPVFQRYLEINTGLVASQGANLFVGKTLGEGKFHAEILGNETVRLAVRNDMAASWFYPNTVTIWEKEKYVLERTTAVQRKAISVELEAILNSKDGHGENVWVMRRMALKRNK